MAEHERIPFWGGLLHPAHLSLDCGCDCINCDERGWCEEQFFKALSKEIEIEREAEQNDDA